MRYRFKFTENIKLYVFLFLLAMSILLGLLIAYYVSIAKDIDNLRSYQTDFNEALESGDYKEAKYELNKMVIYKNLPKKYRNIWEIEINNCIEEYESQSGLEYTFTQP